MPNHAYQAFSSLASEKTQSGYHLLLALAKYHGALDRNARANGMDKGFQMGP